MVFFGARLVAHAQSQIPGVNFSENYPPVVHNITYPLLISAMIISGLSAKIIDFETAFLDGDLDDHLHDYLSCKFFFSIDQAKYEWSTAFDC